MGIGFRAPTSGVLVLVLQLALFSAAIQTTAVHAQLVPSVGAASAPAVNPMERAQRQADNVMRWIKVHADKPRPAPVPPSPPPSPPPAAKPVAPKATALVPPTPEPQKPEPVAPPPVEVPVPPPVAVPAPVAPVVAPPPPVEEEDETPLKALAQDQPLIPRNVLNSLNGPGKVMVQFKVEANGSVSNVQVLSSSRMQLNRPTIAAVTNWRFEPVKTARVAQIEFAFTP